MKVVLAALLCLCAGAWCAAADGPAPNFVVEAQAMGLARIEVRVTGPDIKEPVTASLEAKAMAVADWMAIPPGGSRQIEVILFGAKGETLALGKAVEDIPSKGPATIVLAAETTNGDGVMHVVFSTQKLTLVQLEGVRKDGKVGMQAVVTDAQGRQIPIKKGALVWRDMNQPGPGGAIDPRNPGIAWFDVGRPGSDKYRLNVCACPINQPCRCTPPPQPMRYIDVTAGQRHSCAIDQQHRAFCWGTDFFGQLGATVSTICPIDDPMVPVPALPCSLVPVPVGGNQSLTQISAGSNHTCALDTAGDIWCWGRNDFGQLGTGAVSALFAPQAIPLRVNAGTKKFKEVGAGFFHSCALGTDNLVYCWGRTACGQVNPDPATATPQAVSTTQTFTALSVGPEHNCAITTTGTPMCWGKGASGQLGDANPIRTCASTPQVAAHSPAVINPTRIAAGGHSSCIGSAIGYDVMDGSITCWGGLGAHPGAQHFMAMTVQMSLGGDDRAADHLCAFNPAGTMHCWGSNFAGLLGVGSMQNPVTQPAFVQPATAFRDLDAGARHTCAINAAGEVVCWGANENGQLGNGSQSASAVPVRPLLFYLAPAIFSLPPPNRPFP